VKRLVVVVVLLLVVLTPSVGLAWNMWCDIAAETGKVSDWFTCGVVAFLMGDAEELRNGWLVYGG